MTARAAAGSGHTSRVARRVDWCADNISQCARDGIDTRCAVGRPSGALRDAARARRRRSCEIDWRAAQGAAEVTRQRPDQRGGISGAAARNSRGDLKRSANGDSHDNCAVDDARTGRRRVLLSAHEVESPSGTLAA